MRRRDLLTLIPGTAALSFSSVIAPVTGSTGLTVNVKRDFGAKGNGAADDWQAIENANNFLDARGGGRMYFPGGRYRLPTFGKNIVARNNVEYCGDGYNSVIIGSNAAFISPQGAIFGRNSYGNYAYYAVHDIDAGDQSIRTVRPIDAENFHSGDIVILRSRAAIESPGDILPYYVEMNRVISVKDGVLGLEDPIDDGWSGVLLAKVTDDVSQNYAIHDLRIECENGHPFFIQASYKGEIRNCWTRGLSVVCNNAFTRSVAHDIVATVLWSAGGSMASPVEIETGSVRATVHDVKIQIQGTSTPGSQYPLFYCQEFSRRTNIKNVQVVADGLVLGGIMLVTAGGHRLENIHVSAQAIDKVLDYSCGDPTIYTLNHLPMMLKGIIVDLLDPVNGLNHGFILHNDYSGGTVENVTVQDCVVNGVSDAHEHNLIWLLQGKQKNILFQNVRGTGDVRTNTVSVLPSTEDPEANTPSHSQPSVVLRDCEYRRIASKTTLEDVIFINCRRNSSRLLETERWPPFKRWTSSIANKVLLQIIIPADTPVCWGDYVAVRLSVAYPACAHAAYVAVKIFGAVRVAFNLSPSRKQDVDIDLRICLVNHSFAAPDKFVVTGTAGVKDNANPQIYLTDSFDTGIANAVELQAWIEKDTDGDSSFTVETASIEYVPVEG